MSIKRVVSRVVDRLFGRTIVRTGTIHDLRRSDQTHRAQLAEAERRIAQLQRQLAHTARQSQSAGSRPKPKPKPRAGLPADYHPDVVEMWPMVKSRTMIGHHKLNSLMEATRYITHHRIPGGIVECGVWRGGAMMAVSMLLDRLGDQSRDLYLFDTYTGMSEPTDRDIHLHRGQPAHDVLAAKSKAAPIWQPASLDDVQAGFETVNYPSNRLHYVAGKVEDTIPDQAPQQIAILRLDTDWYESTKHELDQLYARLVPGGVLIIDDYGSWQGSRDATDEFLAATGEPLLLTRVSRGRIAVKPGLTPPTTTQTDHNARPGPTHARRRAQELRELSPARSCLP